MTIAPAELKLRDYFSNWVKVEEPLLQCFSFGFPYLLLDSASRAWHMTHFDGSFNGVDENDLSCTFWWVKGPTVTYF